MTPESLLTLALSGAKVNFSGNRTPGDKLAVRQGGSLKVTNSYTLSFLNLSHILLERAALFDGACLAGPVLFLSPG
jgi:hypothetical protein